MAKKDKKPDHFYGSITDLIEEAPSAQTSDIELMRLGKWDHPFYGEFEITLETLQQFKENFYADIRKRPLPIDREHRTDEGAVGWLKDVYIADDQNRLMGTVEWTDDGYRDIKAKKYRNFSPEYADEYEDPRTGMEYKNVLMGGGITNRPFFQELEEIVVLSDPRRGSQFNSSSSKGGEKNMTKEELKEKLKADPTFKPAEEDKVTDELMAETQKEIADEAAAAGDGGEGGEGDGGEGEGGEGEGAEGGEGKGKPAPKQASEKGKTVQMSESRVKQLEADAAMGRKAFKEMRENKMTEKIKSFTYSESNKGGSILPVSVKSAKALMFSLSEHQQKLFSEFLTSLPAVTKLFTETGKVKAVEEGGEDSNDLDTRAKKLMSEQPEKFKTYSEAAYEAEKQMKKEGKEIQY